MAKKKGADGKECWDGYRYGGTENGKDKCIKVEAMEEMSLCKECALAMLEDIKSGKSLKTFMMQTKLYNFYCKQTLIVRLNWKSMS